MTHNILGTKYPLMAAAMNQVSDANLAIAVREAGALPSISIFNYADHDNNVDYSILEEEISKYIDATGSALLVLSVDPTVIDIKFIELLQKHSITHMELIPNYEYIRKPWLRSVLEHNLLKIQALGTKIILKVVAYPEDIQYWSVWNNKSVDMMCVKGPLGAGRVTTNNVDLVELTKQATTLGIPVIAVGGVSTSEQVKMLLEAGAVAVSAGTLLAASIESCLSIEAKQKLVSASYNDISQLATIDLSQNALVITDVDPTDTVNNSKGLIHGVTTGTNGHIFAGKGIDSITQIDTVKNIIERLFT
jgi:NAD(P)H-dependent flavin oxidoreductase YrpB (nitropropane dioxygenase family)